MTGDALVGALEAVLFVSGEPAPLDRLRQSLGCTEADLGWALDELDRVLLGRGTRVQRGRDGIQLVTSPECSEAVERFLGIQSSSKPSPAAIETLAIVAYRQPVSRSQVEEIRGVNSERVLRALGAQGLIQEVGRSSSLGRPVLYGTTDDFLQRFGLGSLEKLPAMTEEGAETGSSAVGTEDPVPPDAVNPYFRPILC